MTAAAREGRTKIRQEGEKHRENSGGHQKPPPLRREKRGELRQRDGGRKMYTKLELLKQILTTKRASEGGSSEPE